jgi:hypothetical protein
MALALATARMSPDERHAFVKALEEGCLGKDELGL